MNNIYKFILIIFIIIIIDCSDNGGVKINIKENDIIKEDNINKGSLIIVGGALKTNNKEIFTKFIELAGCNRISKIAIIPTATKYPYQSSIAHKKALIEWGVPEKNIWIVPISEINDRETLNINEELWKYSGNKSIIEIRKILENEYDKNKIDEIIEKNNIMGADEIVKKLDNYNAVWFTGGWQGRTRNLLMIKDENNNWKDGIVLEKIRKIYENGGVIGGTSAGAAIMSDPMIDGGTSLGAMLQGSTYEDPYEETGNEKVYITKGFGFWKDGMIDQHFLKRGRFGRLIASMVDSGHNIGIGIDENTAIVIKNDSETIEVIGETGVIIVEIDDAEIKKNSDGKSKVPFNAKNIKLSYLENEDKYYYNEGKFEFAKYKLNKIKGNEQESSKPNINGNVFNKDALIDHMIRNLVDNIHNENFGIAFDGIGELDGVEAGDGLKFRFYKKEDTNGVWGRKNFNDNIEISVTNVYLDIYEIKVKIIE